MDINHTISLLQKPCDLLNHSTVKGRRETGFMDLQVPSCSFVTQLYWLNCQDSSDHSLHHKSFIKNTSRKVWEFMRSIYTSALHTKRHLGFIRPSYVKGEWQHVHEGSIWWGVTTNCFSIAAGEKFLFIIMHLHDLIISMLQEPKWLRTHLKPVEHGSNIQADFVGVVDCIGVQLLSHRYPINNNHIGLAFTPHHCRDQLVHPAFEHTAHLREKRKVSQSSFIQFIQPGYCNLTSDSLYSVFSHSHDKFQQSKLSGWRETLLSHSMRCEVVVCLSCDTEKEKHCNQTEMMQNNWVICTVQPWMMRMVLAVALKPHSFRRSFMPALR